MPDYKHTPGPWKIDGLFDDEVSIGIVSEASITIVEMEPFAESWTDEEIANAGLIAAAPDLLDAVKRARLAFSNMLEFNLVRDEDRRATIRDIVRQCNAAIFSATHPQPQPQPKESHA